MSTDTFNLAPKALEKIWEFAQADNIDYPVLRLSVTGGGCSGFKYGFKFDKVKEGDHVFEFATQKQHTKIVIDSNSWLFLKNSTLHYEESMERSGFRFSNPQEKSCCGCGESVCFEDIEINKN